MPTGPLGFPRLTNVGPLVNDDPWKTDFEAQADVDIFFKSSEDMSELDERSVHLAVTSPPYNLDWDYGSFYDVQEYQDYMDMLSRVFSETYRVLEQQGRLCINVPTLVRQGSEGGVSHMSDIIKHVLENSDDDWRIREVIIWNKMNAAAPRYGTEPEPWGVLLTNIHECIIVAQKPGRRRGNRRPRQDIRDQSMFSERRVDGETLTDVWDIAPDSQGVSIGDEKVPTFPREIPRRLIAIYSYKTDTVLDPFAGSGRTLGVAKSMGRNSVGYELREQLAPIMEDEIGVRLQEPIPADD